jgi:hypothetical protein
VEVRGVAPECNEVKPYGWQTHAAALIEDQAFAEALANPTASDAGRDAGATDPLALRLRLLANGYVPIPVTAPHFRHEKVKSSGKQPFFNGWNRLSAATVTPEMVRSLPAAVRAWAAAGRWHQAPGGGAGRRAAVRGAWHLPRHRRGRRVVRTGLVSLARKNGKSGLAAALALAHLAGPEAVRGGQCYRARPIADRRASSSRR